MKQLLLWLMVLIVMVMTACQKIDLIRPDGFAIYQNNDFGYRFVSPDNIMYRVRAHENKEKADLTFWKTALKTHLLDSGYILLRESEISAKSTPGYLLRLSAPAGVKDYDYLVALFAHKEKLVVIESAGESRIFENYRQNIIDTIKNTDIAIVNLAWLH